MMVKKWPTSFPLHPITGIKMEDLGKHQERSDPHGSVPHIGCGKKIESYWIIFESFLSCIEYQKLNITLNNPEYLVVSVPSLIAQIDFLFDRLRGSLLCCPGMMKLPATEQVGSKGICRIAQQWRFIAGNIQKHHRKYSWVMFHDHFWFESGMCSNIQWITRWTKPGMIFTMIFHHDFLGNSGCPWEVHDNTWVFPGK